MKYIITFFLSSFILSSCTWVNENPAGRDVAIASNEQVENCQKKGEISVQVKGRVGFYDRNAKKVLKELQTLARNEAIKLGANTIVANKEPEKGQQTYRAYYCS